MTVIGGVGLSATITRAQTFADQMHQWEAIHGAAYADRVLRMYHRAPWGLAQCRVAAEHLAVFEWMATPA